MFGSTSKKRVSFLLRDLKNPSVKVKVKKNPSVQARGTRPVQYLEQGSMVTKPRHHFIAEGVYSSDKRKKAL